MKTEQLEEKAIAILQSLKSKEINQDYAEDVRAFDNVVEKLDLKPEDIPALHLLVDQIRIGASNATYNGEENAFFDEYFIEDAEKYNKELNFGLQRYNFDALSVLDFFDLKQKNTVTVKLFKAPDTTGFEFRINEKHSVINLLGGSDIPDISSCLPKTLQKM